MPSCQKEQLYTNFDPDYKSKEYPCYCCYGHIKKHYDETQCLKCKDLLERYCMNHKRKPSIMKVLKQGVKEFCDSRKVDKISCSNQSISFSVEDFANDLGKVYDEISNPSCLVKYYGIPVDVAQVIFTIIQESIESQSDNNVESWNEDSYSDNSDSDTSCESDFSG